LKTVHQAAIQFRGHAIAIELQRAVEIGRGFIEPSSQRQRQPAR
jgi:hypothetical protein